MLMCLCLSVRVRERENAHFAHHGEFDWRQAGALQSAIYTYSTTQKTLSKKRRGSTWCTQPTSSPWQRGPKTLRPDREQPRQQLLRNVRAVALMHQPGDSMVPHLLTELEQELLRPIAVQSSPSSTRHKQRGQRGYRRWGQSNGPAVSLVLSRGARVRTGLRNHRSGAYRRRAPGRPRRVRAPTRGRSPGSSCCS